VIEDFKEGAAILFAPYAISSRLIELTGFAAGAICTVSFLPQLLKVYKEKSAENISWWYLVTFTFGVALWLLYGLMLSALPIIVANGVTLALLGCIITLKIKYQR
jgi:MtN3 and saliva related transmembrane protein